MVDINDYAIKLNNREINGLTLSEMVNKGEISKQERRKITKLSQNLKKDNEELSERQKLRLSVKEKKKLPKLSKDDRRKKFQKDLDTDREKEAANFTICLGCRKRGHFVIILIYIFILFLIK